MTNIERALNVVKTARALRAAQQAYMTFCEVYPEKHAMREQAGRLVESAAAQLDIALCLFDGENGR